MGYFARVASLAMRNEQDSMTHGVSWCNLLKLEAGESACVPEGASRFEQSRGTPLSALLRAAVVQYDGNGLFFTHPEAKCIDLQYPHKVERLRFLARLLATLGNAAEDFEGALLWLALISSTTRNETRS